MATMIKNKVLIIISSKSNHVELIGNHYFGIYENSKRKYLDLASIFGAQSIEKKSLYRLSCDYGSCTFISFA